MSDDRQRVEALYRELGPVIYRRCLKLLRNPADAEDATQEVFLRVTKSLASFTWGPSHLPWVYEIATRHCLNRLRDSRRRGQALAALPAPGATEAGLPQLADRELAEKVLARFSGRSGTIATYALVDGMTQEEVAEALGLDRKTVGTRLRRFLADARKYLERLE